MTARSRRGGESQKDDPSSGRHSTRGASGNTDQENDGHSGSQGTCTSDNSEISHPPARGIVSMLKVKKNRSKGIFVEVNWNNLGQPIGKESVTLAHYVGALARRTFPITVTDFRKKELTQAKERFWDEIMATFKGLDINHKNIIISRAGYYHRMFRTRLRNLARDDDGNYSAQPPILYRELSTVTPYWSEFVGQALKEEFKIVNATLDSYERGIDLRGESLHNWVDEVVRYEGRSAGTENSSNLLIVRPRPETKDPSLLTREEVDKPKVWAQICIQRMVQLAKESTTMRQVLDPMFVYFDTRQQCVSNGLAFIVLSDMAYFMESPGS